MYEKTLILNFRGEHKTTDSGATRETVVLSEFLTYGDTNGNTLLKTDIESKKIDRTIYCQTKRYPPVSAPLRAIVTNSPRLFTPG